MFKLSLRSLVKNKAYTLINVIGLALGMACGILIFALVTFQLSYDGFHADGNRIYRFVTEEHRDNIDYASSVPPAFGSAFRKDYTFAEKTARIVTFNGEFITITEGNDVKSFKEDNGIAFAEPEYFDIFNFPLLRGDKATALTEPATAVITQRTAEKYFGSQDPINKVFKLGNLIPVKVTGVLNNLPANTDQKAEVFLSYPTLKTYSAWFMKDDSWGGIGTALQCFTKLKPNVLPQQVEKAVAAYVTKYRPKSRNVHHYKLQPLTEVHFDARYGGAMEKRTLWILSFIGLFIIITACVNFINLATAQALKRAKEVGVRKVLGSGRSQLFWQFIGETAIIALAGIVAATSIAMVALPYVNALFNTQMVINVFTNITLLGFLVVLLVVITFMAGSYPAVALTRFKPVAALKGKISQQHIGGFNTRRGLIITQFAISQVLMIGMIVIAVQMHYTKGSSLGFDKEAVIMVPIGNDSTGALFSSFKTALAKMPDVKKVSACYQAPASRSDWSTAVRYNNHAEDENFLVSVKSADDKYIPTFGLEMAAGRNIAPSDTLREFLVNETFVRKLNLKSPEEVLGKTIAINGGNTKAQVVGVVKDFHDKSYHADINAVCIGSLSDNYSYFAIKIDMRHAPQTLAKIEKTWGSLYTNQVYDYKFLDDHIAEFYATEETMLTLVQAFAFMAIFIGCLGLYGLVMFMAVQKTKEIGIRKVLGGTVPQILLIFGKEFAGLILIAFVIAAPVAWWVMHAWLQDFKFHITISPLFFVATIALMFVIAALTVGYQATRAALSNPVKSLKTE